MAAVAIMVVAAIVVVVAVAAEGDECRGNEFKSGKE